MRPILPLALFVCLASAGCGSPSSQTDDTFNPELAGRMVAPPALEPEVEPAANGATEPQGATPAAQEGQKSAVLSNRFSGTVDGFALTPTYSFFLQGVMKVGDAQPTLVFVQTDAPNLCQHIAQGTMPKNATMFAAALVQTDGKPVQKNYSYTAPGHHGLDEDPRSIAFFRKLNGTCEIMPNESGAQAMYGQAIIRSLVPFASVTIDFAYDFEEMGAIKGHVEAPFCDAPSFFENPEQFYMPIDPADCKDQ